MTDSKTTNGQDRRTFVKVALTGAVALGALPVLAQTQEGNPVLPNGHRTYAYPRPPFQAQSQKWPGLSRDMVPRPDIGESTYRGAGRLSGMRALITGGDSGIGSAVALAFAREGADIAINYLPFEEPDAREIIRLIKAEGRKAVALPGDLREEAFCQRLVSDAARELGGLDILVSNAGRQQVRATIADVSTQDFDDTLKTNVYALFWLTKAAVPLMQPGSAIVVTSSRLGGDPQANLIDYGMSKAAGINFVKSMSKQLASRGIRVNAVTPAQVWTPLHVTGGSTPENQVNLGAGLAIGRPGQPAEVAPLYVMAADPSLFFSTGQIFGATGGNGQPG
ncbi:SDR family oxidoreductase [Pseudomonas gingeri]|uniref:SDR family oxidoreductase n=1 Tax=Pseudomonas gingeri TaxID=117681 RepID=UPI0015A06C52|nr:SDR family oxidoreductase [Pseudomonas gingeri]NWD04161.1 SDR family oxidoreductase [Pseudomonas gingeri]NWE34207.1 SDR family oxidoreductase [Pseudomonas gingeri]NWE56541.1 SDR family oxidoreductase [Pseudomonas gingeri]NWF05757.1 SDR family oxidoreductase [Pseudomonas gingeri]